MSEIKKWMKLVEGAEITPKKDTNINKKSNKKCDCRNFNCTSCFPDNTKVVESFIKDRIVENQWDGELIDSEYALQIIDGAYQDAKDYDTFSRAEMKALQWLEHQIQERYNNKDIDYATVKSIIDHPRTRYPVEDSDQFIERVFGNQLIAEPDVFEESVPADSTTHNPNITEFSNMVQWMRAAKESGLKWYIEPTKPTDEGSMYIALDNNDQERGYFLTGGVEQRGILASDAQSYAQEMGGPTQLNELLPAVAAGAAGLVRGAAGVVGSKIGQKVGDSATNFMTGLFDKDTDTDTDTDTDELDENSIDFKDNVYAPGYSLDDIDFADDDDYEYDPVPDPNHIDFADYDGSDPRADPLKFHPDTVKRIKDRADAVHPRTLELEEIFALYTDHDWKVWERLKREHDIEMGPSLGKSQRLRNRTRRSSILRPFTSMFKSRSEKAKN